MRNVVTFSSVFVLSFKIKKSDIRKVDKLLNENNIIPESWTHTPFSNIIEYRVNCSLKRAELIRQLIKNITVYG